MAMTDARVQAGLTTRQTVRALRQSGSRVDKPLLSKMEHGLCYPNRTDRETLAQLYNTHPDALASYNAPFEAVATAPETPGTPSQSKRPGDRHRLSCRISHRVSAEQREGGAGREGLRLWYRAKLARRVHPPPDRGC